MDERNKSGLATAGLVLGIIGICTSFIPIINNVSFVLGLIGAIFSIVALAKKASKGKAIAGIILCILSIIVTVNSQKALSDSLNEVSANLDKSTGASTEEILANDLSVELGDFKVTKKNYGITSTKLTVKLTNKTKEKKSFSLHIEAIDNSGARIDEDYIYANDLSAGQSQSFDIFSYVSSDKLNAMKNATFNIAEASMY